MPDVIVALVMFALIFAFITTGNWVLAVIFGIVSVVMFMPTQDGIFYACILENVRFLFSKKKYTAGAKSAKESVDALIPLKGIKENGLIEYAGGSFGRVIKIGQKNFGIEDEVQQNIDINYFANALKLIGGNQSADIVKIDRPVNLDAFAGELFGRLNEVRENTDTDEVKKIKDAILKERIDAIDRLNNIRKQYISDYYIVLYGRNELDLKNTAVNVSSEINKCGLNTKLLDKRKTAVFLKYNYSRNFDEREVKDLSNEESYYEWVKQFYDAFAKSSVPVLMMHDDITWTSGKFASREWYDRNVLPYLKQLLEPCKRAGKKILFTSDGDYGEFTDAIVDSGADMLFFEPGSDMEGFAKRHGKTHGFVGDVDTRVLLTGTKEDIEREVRRVMRFGKEYPGFVCAVGNHIPPNTPVDNALWYDEFYRKYIVR